MIELAPHFETQATLILCCQMSISAEYVVTELAPPFGMPSGGVLRLARETKARQGKARQGKESKSGCCNF